MQPVTCSVASYQATADGFDIAYSYETDRCTSGTSALHDVLVHVSRDGVIRHHAQLLRRAARAAGKVVRRAPAIPRRARDLEAIASRLLAGARTLIWTRAARAPRSLSVVEGQNWLRRRPRRGLHEQ